MTLADYEAKIELLKAEFMHAHGAAWSAFVQSNDPALKAAPAELLPQLLWQYPSLTAIATWQKAHEIAASDPVEALALANAAKVLTGIEIHPEANLSWKTFIDHGAADVIGGDVALGEGSMLYSNVVLGNFNGTTDAQGHRHPQIGDHAVISTDVRIYGPCHIGKNVRIHPGARIINTDIGDNVVIGPNVQLNHAPPIPDNHYVTAKGQEVTINSRSAPQSIIEQAKRLGETFVRQIWLG